MSEATIETARIRARARDAAAACALAAAMLLGSWEGFDCAPPVARDLKIVLAIQRIAPEGGEGILWAGTNLQYPTAVYR